jgi:Na+-driven multidrug efflux pump
VQGAGFFQAVRKPVHSILLSLSRQAIILVPALIILPKFFGLDGILYAGPVSDLIAFVITVPLLVYHLRHLIPTPHVAVSNLVLKKEKEE